MNRYYISILLCLFAISAQAQEKKLVREGNKLYEAKRYKDAANAYQQALMKNPTYTPGLFNLGNSLYQEKQFDAARKVLSSAAKTTNEKDVKGGMNYNIGNTYMAEQKWEDAINAYKQALRNNPQDADAKYNLSYAQQMLKKQQQQDKNKNNKDKNKDDKNKDKNKQDKNKQDQDKNKQDQQNKDGKDKEDKQDQQDQQNKDQQDKEDKQDQRPQAQPSKLSEKQAEQLLNALQQEEKKLQDKLQKGKGVPVKVEKDW